MHWDDEDGTSQATADAVAEDSHEPTAGDPSDSALDDTPDTAGDQGEKGEPFVDYIPAYTHTHSEDPDERIETLLDDVRWELCCKEMLIKQYLEGGIHPSYRNSWNQTYKQAFKRAVIIKRDLKRFRQHQETKKEAAEAATSETENDSETPS